MKDEERIHDEVNPHFRDKRPSRNRLPGPSGPSTRPLDAEARGGKSRTRCSGFCLHRTDRSSWLENPRPKGGISTLRLRRPTHFHAEPKQPEVLGRSRGSCPGGTPRRTAEAYASPELPICFPIPYRALDGPQVPGDHDALPGAGHRCTRRSGFSDHSVCRQSRPGAAKVRRARDPFLSEDAVGAIPRGW